VKNGIEDLRNHLFETLEALKDPDRPMDIERAKAIAQVANAVIASAKVEVDFMEVTGQVTDTKFLRRETPPGASARRLTHG
jgi:hypothetical protein